MRITGNIGFVGSEIFQGTCVRRVSSALRDYSE